MKLKFAENTITNTSLFIGGAVTLLSLTLASASSEVPPQFGHSAATPLSAKLSVVGRELVDLQPFGKTEGSAPPSYDETIDNADVEEDIPVLGLDVGLANVSLISMGANTGSSSSSDLSLDELSATSATGSANDLNLKLGTVELLGEPVVPPAIQITAVQAESEAGIQGALLSYTTGGDSSYTGLVVSVLGVSLPNIPTAPAVNTAISLEAAGLAGATLMLNEEHISGNAASGYTITRNAIRLSLNNVDLGISGLGLVSGDVLVGHSFASQISDSDSDGIDDFSDGDADGDGIPNIIEIASGRNGGDSDGDLIPDVIDLDSDGDGIGDLLEAGGTDPDGDGRIAASGDGNPDEDGDGIVDTVDPDDSIGDGLTGTALTFPDTDLDGIADTVDLDSDNDGVSDLLEGNGDADGDMIPANLDHDSDNDSIADVIEAGGVDIDSNGEVDPSNDGNPDEDGDGIVDTVDPDDSIGSGLFGTELPRPDTDGDGVRDIVDLDSDNDGIGDATEALLGDGNADGDDAPNYIDLDSDNDGINDVIEAGGVDPDGDGMIAGSGDGNDDEDGDGVLDTVDPDDSIGGGLNGIALAIPDTDGDLVPNYLDLDSDNDTISDILESGNGIADRDHDGFADGGDTDNDGIAASTDGLPGEFGDSGSSELLNTDGDDLPNYIDPDSDNDGITDIDSIGNGGLDSDNDGMIDLPIVDADGDGVDDTVDSDPNNPGGTIALITGDEWLERIPNEADRGWDADPDSDGATNASEFFSGTDPLDPNCCPQLSFDFVAVAGENYLEASVERDPTALVFGRFQISTDLDAWSFAAADSDIEGSDDTELIARGRAAVGPAQPRAFMRLLVVVP